MQVEAEVVRLETLKECRMKDLVVKKHEELMEIRRRARLPEDDTAVMVFDAIDSGNVMIGVLEKCMRVLFDDTDTMDRMCVLHYCY